MGSKGQDLMQWNRAIENAAKQTFFNIVVYTGQVDVREAHQKQKSGH